MTPDHDQARKSMVSERATTLVDRITNMPKSWVPIDGEVMNITFLPSESELVVTALRRLAAQDQKPVACDLRAANIARQKEWDAGNKLTLAFRGNELAGEVGEACNVIKKLERERLGIAGSRDTTEHLADELADVVICADLIALDAGIDLLGKAVPTKFNATSEKIGLKTRLYLSPPPAAGWDEAIEACKKIADTWRTSANPYRADTANAICQGIEALRHNAPPDSGAGKLETELPPLTCDFAQALPGGKLDDSTYSKIEDALDKIEAPVQDASGKWLSLYERIAAIALPDHGGADAGVVVTDDMLLAAMRAENAECDPEENGPTKHSMRAAIEAALALSKPAPVGSMSAQWTYDPEAEAYYFAPMQSAPGPYSKQRHVDAIIDIAADGTLAGVELIDNMPPPPPHHPAPVAANASAVLQNDLAEMLRALGMSDAAQPKSPHEVFQSALAEMKRQLPNASAEARLRDHLGIVLSALRMHEEATGESFDDDGGDIAAIEREYNALSAHPHASDGQGEAIIGGTALCGHGVMAAICEICNHPSDRTADVTALADAMWQLLDDMGENGQGVCLAAKAQARVAYEAFREDEYADWMPLDRAKQILKEAGA